MVLQKRLDHRFNGYQVPTKPRATRSPRGRATFQRKVEDNQMLAFELLATVAGDLLQENQNPTTSCNGSSEKDQGGFVKEENQDANKPFKAELSDEASCDRRYQQFVKEGCLDANMPLKAELSDEGNSDRKSISNLSSEVYDKHCCMKEYLHPEIDGHSFITSTVTSSSCSERFLAEMVVDERRHNEMKKSACKVELGSTGCPNSIGCKLDDDASKVNDELHKLEKVPIGTGTGVCCFEDPLDEKPPALINTKLSGYDDNVPVVSRDDDENFSGCAHPSTKTRPFRPRTCIVEQRIGKNLASKYQKVAQESKHDTLPNSVSDGNLKPVYSSRRDYYKRQRSEMNIPFKKRKLFNCSSGSNSNGFIRSGRTYKSPENDMNQGVSYSSSGISKDPGMETHKHSALQSRNPHVKLRIKSFRVPELFIEIPETATIGSLKRAVMEAVTAALGGGLRVGMIFHGKKVRDDSKTLIQTGISHDNQLDTLGFTLEPNSSKNIPLTCAADSLHVLGGDMPQSLIGHRSSPAVTHERIKGFSNMLPEHQVASLGNFVESDHDSAPSPINTSVEKNLKDSKELVTVPEMSKDALAVLPVHQKSKRTENVQRRIRRPFSVAEVEALVQAVEKLGTGRWRDVKLCAFDDAKHRTYVDLKDKWKTLVHTARISPQQRRGEPVPQELLDRVLTAHAYWSQQQSKQQPETCLLLQ